MSTITITKENFISQLPELYDLVVQEEEITIGNDDEVQLDVVIKDLQNGVNTVTLEEYMHKRWLTI